MIAGATPATAVFATTYTYADLGPGPNGKDADGYGLSANAQGGSYFDHTILPRAFTSSEAYSIDKAGTILGSAFSTTTGSFHAVECIL